MSLLRDDRLSRLAPGSAIELMIIPLNNVTKPCAGGGVGEVVLVVGGKAR